MSQNFTIDDSDPTLVYTSGWGIASTEDLELDNYFQATYHATQTSGSNVSLAFSGAAIYLYGSKGPDRGNFSVRYDNLVQMLTARADTLSYRQLLFSAHLPSGNHSLTITYTDESSGWFDLDFVTVTGAANRSVVGDAITSTISPPPLNPTTTQSSIPLASTSGVITVPVSSVPTNNTTTLVLAIVLGTLLFILATVVAGFLIRRRTRRRTRRRHSSASYPTYDRSKGEDPQSVHSAGSAFLGPQSIKPPIPSSQQSSPTYLGSYPQPPLPTATVANTDRGGDDVQMRQYGRGGPAHVLPAARPWSPFSTPINRMFGAVKDGADSMKSTFLKV